MTQIFRVFDPFIGQYSEHPTEDEAKIAFIEIAKRVFDSQNFSIIQADVNEHGDETWVNLPVSDMFEIVVVGE